MVDRPIAKALIEVVLFFEFSDDETVNPDAAVSVLEQIAANLQLLDSGPKRALTVEIRSLAGDYAPHEQFVRDLPEALGFAVE